MTGLLEGKTAIVTGSGQGIGKAIAVALAKEGAAVVTNNRKPGTAGGDAGSAAREITEAGGRAVPFYGDVSEFETARRMVVTAVDSFGRLDILVNNAGTILRKWVWEISEDEWDRTIDSSLKGTFNTMRHAVEVMRAQKYGRIINTISPAFLGTMGGADYAAAKGGVVSLTKCAAMDMARDGVTCNAYAPVAATRMTLSDEALTWNKMRYELGATAKDTKFSLLEPPPPESGAAFIVYLASEAARDISGQVFRIRGNKVSLYTDPGEKDLIEKEDGFFTVDEVVRRMRGTVLKKI
ncbi:MAG: SDR family NAD(P)-dependent oxidoreductase [Chloroflexi bacterium]|nr:SDR family NAD(P)-dependent oxidoreductase [Chloroflexota bacterium]